MPALDPLVADDSPQKPPEPELLDGDDLDLDATHRALRDLRRSNRWLLGYHSLLRALLPRMLATANESSRENLRVLDVGAGSGDVALVVQRAAQRRGLELRLTGVDLKLRHLAYFEEQSAGSPLQGIAASATHLPFVDNAFDSTVSPLALAFLAAGIAAFAVVVITERGRMTWSSNNRRMWQRLMPYLLR